LWIGLVKTGFVLTEIQMKNVKGKVAFVTGGASGLGLAMAHSFTGAGMKVAIADVEDSALEAAKLAFSDTNSEVITMKVDVTDRDAMAEARKKTLDAFGKVHVVCNNAGVALSGNIAEMSYKDWDWVLKVNLDGVINGIVTFIDDIKSQGEGGHVVNTASIAGHYGMPGLGIYVASKFAVVGMSETMRVDLADDDIGISVLCPGMVSTGIVSSERNRPEQFGGAEKPAMTPREGAAPAEMNVMKPAAIGDIVLHSIQNDVFYIMTHDEFQAPVQRRGEAIASSFEYWRAYREQHGV
jgi:NADP-dependent 3-hydroxy acid dehydrogenase YdfG